MVIQFVIGRNQNNVRFTDLDPHRSDTKRAQSEPQNPRTFVHRINIEPISGDAADL